MTAALLSLASTASTASTAIAVSTTRETSSKGAAAPAGSGSSPQSQTCAEPLFCVGAYADAQDNVVFRVDNRSAFPVTLNLTVSADNLVSAVGNSVSATIPPRQQQTLLEYRRQSTAKPTDYRYRFDWALGDPRADHDVDYAYRLPYATARSYRVLQGFGSHFSHTGRERYAVDFDMPRGSSVHAARDGVVARVVDRHGEGCWAPRCADKANLVVVLHDDGTTGEYYHLSRNSAVVAVGARVTRGQHIAASGNSGHSTMPHLHFGVYRPGDDGRARSLPFRFDSEAGIVDAPQRGAHYQAR